MPHVLDHCIVHNILYKKRHDAIVERIKKAVADKWIIVGENRVVGAQNIWVKIFGSGKSFSGPGDQKNIEIFIIDVAVPFNNVLAAFEEARSRELLKYNQLGKELSSDGNRTSIVALIVGALGSWDPANDQFIKKICSRSYPG